MLIKTNNGELRKFANRATVGFVILAIGIAAAFYKNNQERTERLRAQRISAQQVAVLSCNRDFVRAQRIRVVLNNFRISTAVIPLPDCRDVRNITDDLGDINGLKAEKPYYPGAPYAPDPPSYPIER